MYRFEVASAAAFVQLVAVSYLGSGHFFYVVGRIPADVDVRRVDQKLLAKYGVAVSKWQRMRQRKEGLGSVHYVRLGRFFVLLAAHGRSRFFDDEPHFQDVRRSPIRYGGYSIGYRLGGDGRWHSSVRIGRPTYLRLKRYLVGAAVTRSEAWLRHAFWSVPFEPYAPVRRQLLLILRAMNRRRQVAGLEQLPYAVLRMTRRPVKVFPDTGISSHGVHLVRANIR